jgi:serine/threonine protein kinase
MSSLMAHTATIQGATPKTLFGYEVIEHLGDGAGSRIYAVSDPATNQVYALKHVVRKTDKDARFIEQLEAEHAVGQHVNHPYLRRTIDLKYEKSLLFVTNAAALVMELVDGQSLETSPPQSVLDAVRIFRRTAAAMHALHQLGYVHCDLKPNNIMLQPDGRVKVIDLGQAVKAGTVKERIQGTPDFIAPEQVKRGPVTCRTDVYNYGATMYFALCGKKMPTLFTLAKGENSFLCDNTIQTPAECNPAVPEGLSMLVMDCVRTNPAKRPADFTDVVRRLELIEHSLTRGLNTDKADAPAHRA